MVEKLREADRLLNAGQSVGQVLQHLEFSEPTYHRRRTKYRGMKDSEACWLKELEKNNASLKRLLAERNPRIDILTLAMISPACRPQAMD